MVGFTRIEWKVRGTEPTLYPEPTGSVLFMFSTPAARFEWSYSEPSYPLSSMRILGIPQPGVQGLRPLYLRMLAHGSQFIESVEYAVIDGRRDLSTSMSNVERFRNKYLQIVQGVLEAQAAGDRGSTLVLIEFITGGATSLAHDSVFEMVKQKVIRTLIHRRILVIKVLQLPVQEYKTSLRPEEVEKRLEAYERILHDDSLKIIIVWPKMFSHPERKPCNQDERTVAEEIARLILFLEEISAYKERDVSRNRQLTDLPSFGTIFIPTRVMELGAFRQALRGSFETFTDRGIPLELKRAIALVHGFEGDVIQAEQAFQESVGGSNIVTAMRHDVYGLKSVLLFPVSLKTVRELLDEIRNASVDHRE